MQIKISQIQKIVYSSMFTIISLILAFFIKFPVIPAAPFLKFDVSDVPAFIATLLLGPQYGLSILFCTCLLRSVTFSSAGIVGFIIRMTSAINILCLGCLYKNSKNIFKNMIAIAAGTFLCLLIKIPLNYIFWVYFWGIPKANLNQFIITAIIPFNIIKITINSILAVYIANTIKKIWSRNTNTYH